MPSVARILIGVSMACVAVVVTARAASSQAADPVDPCPAGAVRTVEMAEPVSVDQIVARATRSSPRDGATDVRVSAGHGERVVHLWGAGPQSLEFEPALVGARFEVVIEPVLTAPTSACVAEVVLLHDGEVVAAVAGP